MALLETGRVSERGGRRDESGSGYGPVARSSEHGNWPSGS
jgi:hypothetical protein